VLKHPPIETAKLVSITTGEDRVIHLIYLITDDSHAAIFKEMALELDIDLPPTVCSPKKSGIMDLIEQGFSLSIRLDSSAGKITGGVCPY
jgi:hypothetical protein